MKLDGEKLLAALALVKDEFNSTGNMSLSSDDKIVMRVGYQTVGNVIEMIESDDYTISEAK